MTGKIDSICHDILYDRFFLGKGETLGDCFLHKTDMFLMNDQNTLTPISDCNEKMPMMTQNTVDFINKKCYFNEKAFLLNYSLNQNRIKEMKEIISQKIGGGDEDINEIVRYLTAPNVGFVTFHGKNLQGV